ncbi:LysR family transcriptional regulator [Terrarubrum flagellatum]|uniref:LysR family transcriptional regulator n=1 Tax=Terrirubrum flagellatum TaxID=2895980 RepID=UPI0031457080
MDRLEAMAVLVATAETGSLSGAGRRLGMPLPTVSRKISELEAHLNARLLTRSTRRLALTEAGATYVTASRRILEQVGEAERAASGEYAAPRGELVVAAPIVFGRLHVLPAINEFLALYPDINVRLALSDRVVDLIDDHIDLAVRIGALPDSAMIATRVGSMRRVVCASPAFLAKHREPRSPQDLRSLPCITFFGSGSGAGWRFGSPGGKADIVVDVTPRLSVNTAEAAVDAAISGVGVTCVLAYQAARAVAASELHVILQDFEPPPAPVHLLHAGQATLPLKTRAFLDLAAPYLRRALADILL